MGHRVNVLSVTVRSSLRYLYPTVPLADFQLGPLSVIACGVTGSCVTIINLWCPMLIVRNDLQGIYLAVAFI